MEYISKSSIVKLFGNSYVKESATSQCKKLVSWSWEMLGSILIMMGSPLTVKSISCDNNCTDNETKKET